MSARCSGVVWVGRPRILPSFFALARSAWVRPCAEFCWWFESEKCKSGTGHYDPGGAGASYRCPVWLWSARLRRIAPQVSKERISNPSASSKPAECGLLNSYFDNVMFEYTRRPHTMSYRHTFKSNLPMLGIGLMVIAAILIAMFFAAMPTIK